MADPSEKPPSAQLTAKDLGLEGLQDEDEEALDVLDLPQLYAKPTAPTLLSTLAHLSSEPPSWDTTPDGGTPLSPRSGTSTPHGNRKRKVTSEGIAPYLTRIISSRLAWIEDDNQKEQIWEAASQRLSERSGRSAMGAISRTFVIPLHQSSKIEESISRNPPSTAEAIDLFDPQNSLELTLHEPALTSDNLGLKTWASSYLLAKRMAALQKALPPLPPQARILELGAGTGLVGLAAGAVFRSHVILTDLPDIVENLERNARANAAALASHDALCDVAVLDWSSPDEFVLEGIHDGSAKNFPLILIADPIYSTEHPRLLVDAIAYHLCQDSNARVVIELPLREAYGAEREDLRARMGAIGLAILEQGEEVGVDDWTNGNDEDLAEVRCWWSIWGRT